ncbi:MAG: penicillin-binding protein 2 [Anaerolineae bacterium]|nr:penicillin-binding protein 2 [Anaerolineae bacterium]
MLRIFTVIAFTIIGVRLWDLQIISSAKYAELADRNRYRLVPIDAPRGIIYDRYGRILVRNVPSFAVSILPASLPEDGEERRKVLERVSELINRAAPLPVDEATSADTGSRPEASAPVAGRQTARTETSIETILAERTLSPYAPVRVARAVDSQAAFIIEEEQLELPGVLVQVEPLRHYIDGPLTAHLLGYVGNIPSEYAESYLERGYDPSDQVGLTGIELTQEALLHGVKGRKHIEVDAFEREVAVIASEPAVQGKSIVLTIDVELQKATEAALRQGMRAAGSSVGVCVTMDPRTGEILSLVSLPSYDNNLFSGGISYSDYAELSGNRDRPLVNHAISGQYPPGSTFKIVPAAAALEEGVIDASTRLSCAGTLWLPNRYFPDDLSKAQPFYCWRIQGHGSLDILGGLRQSCDIFFYQLTGGFREFEGLGIERLAKYAGVFGFGEPSGIELSGEAAGLLPSDSWKRHNYGEIWYTGDTYNAAIGQGYILATPLQVLNAAAAVANGGTLYRPQLVYQVRDAEGSVRHALVPEPIRELGIDEANLALVRQGMREAVTMGTAWHAFMPELAVAGKTGTAEYPGLDEQGNLLLDEQGNLPTHAWFTAFAPYEAPEIALVVFLEGGGEGSQVAVPVAAEILRYYFALPPK